MSHGLSNDFRARRATARARARKCVPHWCAPVHGTAEDVGVLALGIESFHVLPDAQKDMSERHVQRLGGQPIYRYNSFSLIKIA